jgi:enamine deaminase RidA (YjgF/YER057c/UK114 family)
MRRRIYSGSPFEEIAGYARAVVDDGWVFVSGTTGYDFETGTISDDPAEQARQCFRNIADALDRAGSSLSDAVRVVIYIADRDDFDAIAGVVGDHFRDIRPANTTVIAELVKPEMKVEIEVTARRQSTGG